MNEKTGYATLTSVNDGILEIAITGRITELDIPVLQREFSSHRKAGFSRLLIDVRALVESRDPGIFYFIRRPENATGKTAIVGFSENEQLKNLCESLTRFTAMQLSCFENMDAARNWLKGTGTSHKLFDSNMLNNQNPGDYSSSE